VDWPFCEKFEFRRGTADFIGPGEAKVGSGVVTQEEPTPYEHGDMAADSVDMLLSCVSLLLPLLCSGPSPVDMRRP